MDVRWSKNCALESRSRKSWNKLILLTNGWRAEKRCSIWMMKEENWLLGICGCLQSTVVMKHVVFNYLSCQSLYGSLDGFSLRSECESSSPSSSSLHGKAFFCSVLIYFPAICFLVCQLTFYLSIWSLEFVGSIYRLYYVCLVRSLYLHFQSDLF